MNGNIRTCNCLVIKALIPCQITISTQQLKLLDEILEYDLYYFLTHYCSFPILSRENNFDPPCCFLQQENLLVQQTLECLNKKVWISFIMLSRIINTNPYILCDRAHLPWRLQNAALMDQLPQSTPLDSCSQREIDELAKVAPSPVKSKWVYFHKCTGI